MPRVKIDYVVSFSSEDAEHPASNLLGWEVSKKKWLCKKGESSCSVVLQLTKAVKISSVHIGAYHSALVEVLVARSEKASDQYQVLVPSCVFVPPLESRRDAPVERVRSFSAEQLASDARGQRWDRVRVVCSQPYNKHCKYGLSFIHIDEPGDVTPQPAPTPTPVPQRMLALDTYSSDDDDFRPGELFAKHLQSSDSQNSDSQGTSSSTGAQIRQATSQALKNISDSATKLMKTPISKPSTKKDRVPSSEGRADRSRNTLLYDDDDEKPHAKIDHIVQRHKDQKDKEDKKIEVAKHDRKDKLNDSHKAKEDRTPKRRKSTTPKETPPSKKPRNSDAGSREQKNKMSVEKKQPEPRVEETEIEAEPHTLLSDVVLVLSGYENPMRANVRNTALAMGARVERDWGPRCTHLICAFPNTPKLRAVRSAGGTSVPIVLADWILQSSQRRRRLPWQWYATEPKYRQPETKLPVLKKREHVRSPPRNEPDEDTDDEIERVLQKQAAKQNSPRKTDASPKHASKRQRKESEETQTVEDLTTEEEDNVVQVPKFGGALPNFFDGYTFVIDADEAEATKLSRYVIAYGGLVIEASQLDLSSSNPGADYVICSRPPGARVPGARVTPAWLARCHEQGRLLDTE